MKRALITAGFSLLLCGVGGTAYAHPEPSYSAPTQAHSTTHGEAARPSVSHPVSSPCSKTPTKTDTGVSSSPATTSAAPSKTPPASSSPAVQPTPSSGLGTGEATQPPPVPLASKPAPVLTPQDSPQLAMTGSEFDPVLAGIVGLFLIAVGLLVQFGLGPFRHRGH